MTMFLEHFGLCGGCKWQHMQYSAQLQFKEQEVSNNLKRIGKVEAETTLLYLEMSTTSTTNGVFFFF